MPIDALRPSDMHWVRSIITTICITIASLYGIELHAQSYDQPSSIEKADTTYCQEMWEAYIESYNNGQWDKAKYYLEEYLDKGEKLLTPIYYANANIILGELELYQLGNINEALAAYKKGIEVLEQRELISEYPYSASAYRGVLLCYYSLNQDDERKAAQTRLTDVMRTLFGEQSEKFISYKEDIISFCVSNKDWYGVIEEGAELINIYKDRGITETVAYLELLKNLITSYHITHDYVAETSLFDEYESVSETLGLKESERYCSYLYLKAEAMTVLFRVDEYYETVNEMITLTHKLWGKFSIQSALQESIIASHYGTMDQNSEAVEHIKKCYEILDSEECRFDNRLDSIRITSQIHNLEGLIYAYENPQAAEEALLKAIEEYTEIGLNKYAPLNNLGLLYHNVYLDYSKALEYFIMASESVENNGQSSSIQYIHTLNNIALCYQNLGMSSYAISIFDLAEQAVLQNYGSEHLLYATIIQNKSKFYGQIGDYDSAIIYGNLAKDCMGRIFGTDSEKYALCLQNLGLFYVWKKQWEEAKEHLTAAVNILDRVNVLHSISAHINLLNIYSNERNWELFDQTANRCIALIKEHNLVGTDTEVYLNGTVGYCMVLNNILEGRQYLKYAMDITEINGNANSAEYFGALIVYHLSSFLDGTQNEEMITSIVESMKAVYFSNAAYYNTSEREAFVSNPRFSLSKDVIFSARSKGDKDSHLYDFLLFNKGLLLGTSLSFAKAVYDSGDEELISKYRELVEINRLLNGEKVQTELDTDAARTRGSVLEREITLALRDNGGYTDGLNYTHIDVQNALGDHEAAVEFVSHLNYLDNTTYYAALILKKESAPTYIRLGKADDIERLATLSPEKIYGETAASKELYDKIWRPVLERVGSARKITFSPAGILNRLAIEQLYDGDKRICESYDLMRVTSTREICRQRPQYRYATAVLYGGLEYDTDIETMMQESQSIKLGQPAPAERFRGCIATDWTPLPGTITEVEEISATLKGGKISPELFTGNKGNEESFKALSGRRFDILHIATHGFYMSEAQARRTEFYASDLFTDNGAATAQSPLSRSGLLLSGGNNAWSGLPIPDSIEDGILSAAEISNLDFNSCDIVVLSACETGLGEITDEGVFGLQRSFKNAGVNTIVMSLWKVDDMATSYMMQVFYRNLIKGKTKREAFSSAQDAVKKKYPAPSYWAAFIMVENKYMAVTKD